MRINIKIFALFVLVAIQGRGFCKPQPFGGTEALTGVLGGLGGGSALGSPGDSVGGLSKKGASGLPLASLLNLALKKNVVLEAVKKFKFIYTLLNMTNKLTDMIGLGDYRCDFETCTGVAYCFGLTREFQLNMSLCADEDKTTTVSPDELPAEGQQQGAGGAGGVGGAGGAGGAGGVPLQ